MAEPLRLSRDLGRDPAPTHHTVAEAARLLGISEGAVRSRIKRRSLSTALVEGRRMVLLPQPSVTEARPGRDLGRDTADDLGADQAHEAAQSLLIAALQEQIADLRARLDASEEGRRRADHLLAGALEDRRALAAQLAASNVGDPRETTLQSANFGPQTSDRGEMASESMTPASDRLVPRRRAWWQRMRGG